MKSEKSTKLKSVVRGTLHSVIATLVLVGVFALIVRFAGVGGGVVTAIAQIIKVISIFYGVRITLKNIPKFGYVYGAIVGLLYMVLAFFIFSILDNGFSVTVGLLNDLIFAVALGIISAIVLRVGKRADV